MKEVDDATKTEELESNGTKFTVISGTGVDKK